MTQFLPRNMCNWTQRLSQIGLLLLRMKHGLSTSSVLRAAQNGTKFSSSTPAKPVPAALKHLNTISTPQCQISLCNCLPQAVPLVICSLDIPHVGPLVDTILRRLTIVNLALLHNGVVRTFCRPQFLLTTHHGRHSMVTV
jgi:hypothetical protein